MVIFLKNKETNELIRTYNNVVSWSTRFIEKLSGGYRSKIYCSDNQYFDNKYKDVEPLEEYEDEEYDMDATN